jgi:hypothetical protein
MITAMGLRQRRADLPSRWSSTECDDTGQIRCFTVKMSPQTTPPDHLNHDPGRLLFAICLAAHTKARSILRTHLTRQPNPHS